ncbi:MAG: S-layer homology domain-containing protein [Clostridia bacterium]|nr:S-layer homology domain-containing protein [Clostridia bacterium]
MKKIIAFTIILSLLIAPASFAYSPFDTLVPQFTALKTDVTNPEVLTGTSKGLDLLINASFIDISSAYGKEAIVRMAALGVVKEYGERRYHPSDAATGYDALTQLVRVQGGEDATMQRVYAQAGSSTTNTAFELLLKQEALTEARNRGIVTANEVIGLNNPVTREQLAVWVARTVGIQDNFTQNTTFAFSDWQSVNPVYRSLIEDLVSDGIMELQNTGTFGPKSTVSRGELAIISKAALETQYGARNIATGFGIVIGVKPETIYNDGNTITRNTVTVKNTDGSVTNLVTEKHSKGTTQREYIVYKNGITSRSSTIKLGDEVEYITLDGELRYVQVLDHNLVLEKINASAMADIYSTFHFGTVSDIRQETRMNKGKSVITEIYRITDITGDVFDIMVDEDTYTGLREDIITYKGGDVAGVQLLRIGDVMEYLVNENREVVYIRVAPLTKQIIAGTVRKVTELTEDTPATMTIFGYDDKVYTLPLAPYANLTINSRLADLKNYVYGMPINVAITNGYILVAEGESYSGEPGYIPPFGKMRIGTVDTVYQNSFSVKLSNGVKEMYTITAGTVFTKEGNPVSQTTLKTGIPVKLYFDDIASNALSKVEIEAPEILFEIIYKGKLKNVNGGRSEVQLVGADGISKPEYITNNDWLQAETFTLDLKLDTKTEIYAGNQKLTMTDLGRKYTNYPVYAVVKSVYGKPTVVKMAVMTGGEMTYSSVVKDVDHTLGNFEINTKENFNLTAGTIVIKDGLVVPNEKINLRDTVFVVSESPFGTYDKNAMVVKVVTPYDNIFNGIRIGAVENINPSTFTIANHTQYQNNFLNGVNPNVSGEYKFYTNTKITDVTDPNAKIALKPADLWHNDYARSENVDPDYNVNTQGLQFERYYTFMVVNPVDSSVIAMNMRHKGLVAGQNIDDTLYKESDIKAELEKTYQSAVLSRGMVTSFDETWDRLEITDSHDWTDYTGQWTANKANIFIRYTDAIIIKNNAVKTIDDIKPGDYIYTMRIKDGALVIFIEN